MKLPKALFTAAVLSLTAMACESDDTERKERDYWGGECHYDCFGGFSCREGQVYRHPHGPIPCDEPNYDQYVRECDEGYLVGECEQGCSELEVEQDWFAEDWSIECEEGRPRIVGDACESDEECEPDRQRPLVCDQDRATCVDEDQPDYLTFCDLADVDRWAHLPTVFLNAPACTAEYCLVQFSTDGEACQGCSFPCEIDADCPLGSRCKDILGEVVSLCEPRAGLPECQ